MAVKIKSNEFEAAIANYLDYYGASVHEAVGKAVDETGTRALEIVKEKSPARKGKNGGRYKKGWKKTVERTGVFGTSVRAIIFNRDKYRLVHLLEDGHEIVTRTSSYMLEKGHQRSTGGRVAGIPHVQPAYEEAERIFPKLLEKAIEEAGTK